MIDLADYILRPILIGCGTKLPEYIVLRIILGGFMPFMAFWGKLIRKFNFRRLAEAGVWKLLRNRKG